MKSPFPSGRPKPGALLFTSSHCAHRSSRRKIKRITAREGVLSTSDLGHLEGVYRAKMAMARPPTRANELAATVPAGLLGMVVGEPVVVAVGVVVMVTSVWDGPPVVVEFEPTV